MGIAGLRGRVLWALLVSADALLEVSAGSDAGRLPRGSVTTLVRPPPAPPSALTIAVDPSHVTDHVSGHMYGSGIETYNHCMYGGFWSNLLYDDSVEDAAKGPLTTVATRDSWFSAGGSCAVQDGGMNGQQSLLLESKGSVAVNRGLVVARKDDSNETAIHFVGEKPYLLRNTIVSCLRSIHFSGETDFDLTALIIIARMCYGAGTKATYSCKARARPPSTSHCYARRLVILATPLLGKLSAVLSSRHLVATSHLACLVWGKVGAC